MEKLFNILHANNILPRTDFVLCSSILTASYVVNSTIP